MPRAPKPINDGLQQIDRYARAIIESRMEHLSTGGHTADVIAQARADAEALAAAIADALRRDYLARTR